MHTKLLIKLLEILNRRTYRLLKKLKGITSDDKERSKDRLVKVNGFKITEHALLRYFERVEGYDLQEIREKITENLLVNPNTVGRYKVGDIELIVEGKTIITLYPFRDLYKGNVNPIKGLEKLL